MAGQTNHCKDRIAQRSPIQAAATLDLIWLSRDNRQPNFGQQTSCQYECCTLVVHLHTNYDKETADLSSKRNE
ncbi:hypothetical protein J6590_106456 [Homalodisca vitripennis]|nr:hypothetical protein J6590_106456 [Homalodisca vitripennis]